MVLLLEEKEEERLSPQEKKGVCILSQRNFCSRVFLFWAKVYRLFHTVCTISGARVLFASVLKEISAWVVLPKKKGQIETKGVISHAVLFVKFHFLFPFRAVRLAKVKSPTKR